MAACLPVEVIGVTHHGTADIEDILRAIDSPEHARLLEAPADYRFASGLDDAGADEKPDGAKLGVAHARGVLAVEGELFLRFGAPCG